MSHVLQFRTSAPDIGLVARKRRKGPEHELVRGFTSAAVESFQSRSTYLAVFHEPQLDTGFPDIVFVEYSPRVFDHWNDPRFSLSSQDLKLLHHLSRIHGADSDTLTRQLGLTSKSLLLSLERLLDAKLIRRYARQWQPVSLKRTFGVTQITSFEAKIKDWKSAFRQAELNKWFASESNVVSPVLRPSGKVVDSSAKLGVGIYTFNDAGLTQVTRGDVSRLPSCYASWLFNEWIGRSLWSQSREAKH